MGNASSSTNSNHSTPAPVIFCDAECQRKKRIESAKEKLNNSKQKLNTAQNNYNSDFNNFYVIKNGPKWIDNNAVRKNSKKLATLQENKQKHIQELTKTYSDKLEILYNQNIVVEKQMEKINDISSKLDKNLTDLIQKRHTLSTNRRKLKYERDNYVSFSNNLGILTISFISTFIIFICLVITYRLLKWYGIKINLLNPIEMPKFDLSVTPGKMPAINRGFFNSNRPA